VGRWWPWHPALPQRTIRLGQSVILTLAPRTRALPLSCPPAGVLIGANIVPERNRSWPSPSSILPNFCQHYAFGVQCTVEMHLHHRGASPPERHPTTELKREPASNFYTSALPSGLQLLLKSHSIVTASPQTETCWAIKLNNLFEGQLEPTSKALSSTTASHPRFTYPSVTF
jgi:hypothetical protein